MQLIDRRSGRLRRALGRAFVGALVVIAVSTTTGWILAARDGRGSPPECYTVSGRVLEFTGIHGASTTRTTFAVEERDDHVMVGHWDESEPGTSTMEAYSADLVYPLQMPLGDRTVVDPAGEPVPAC